MNEPSNECESYEYNKLSFKLKKTLIWNVF